jgi:hypothetical protein
VQTQSLSDFLPLSFLPNQLLPGFLRTTFIDIARPGIGYTISSAAFGALVSCGSITDNNVNPAYLAFATAELLFMFSLCQHV